MRITCRTAMLCGLMFLSATTLRAQGPEEASLAPPGPYMLFLVNDRGVPSQAKIVTIGR